MTCLVRQAVDRALHILSPKNEDNHLFTFYCHKHFIIDSTIASTACLQECGRLRLPECMDDVQPNKPDDIECNMCGGEAKSLSLRRLAIVQR